MTRFLARRLLQGAAALLIALCLLHAAVFAMPGDPIRTLFGIKRPDPQVVADIRASYGLDDPYGVQLLRYLGGVVTGDLGPYYTGAFHATNERAGDVDDIVRATAPTTLRIVAIAVVLQLLAGTAIGMLAGRSRRLWVDRGWSLLAIVAVVVPPFVVAVLLQTVFGVDLQWFPVTGGTGWWGAILPGAALAVVPTGLVAMVTREQTRAALREPWVPAATAKGVPRWRISWVHALKLAAAPAITVVGAEVGALLGGAVVVEGVFRTGGTGAILFDAIQQKQGPTILGIVTVFTVVVLLVTLVTDLVTAALDPRRRLA